MDGCRVEVLDPARRRRAHHPLRFPGFELPVGREHHLSCRRRQHPPGRREQLHPVVAGRVVAGRDLDAAGGGPLPHGDAHRRRGRDAAIDHVAAGHGEPGRDRRRQQRPALTAVAAEQNRPRGQRRCKGKSVSGRHLRRERTPHNTPQPRHAHDQRFVDGRGVGSRARGGVAHACGSIKPGPGFDGGAVSDPPPGFVRSRSLATPPRRPRPLAAASRLAFSPSGDREGGSALAGTGKTGEK